MRARALRSCVVCASAIALAWLSVPGGGVAASETGAPAAGEGRKLRVIAAADLPAPTGPRAELTSVQKAAIAGDLMVADPEKYRRTKAAADARAGSAPSSRQTSRSGPQAPISIRNWQGVDDPNSTPSDSTGSIGTTRYIENANREFAIYNRTSDAPVGTGTLVNFYGVSSGNAFDPQVMWDPEQSRFFYAGDFIDTAGTNYLTMGFSKGSSPNTAADFCQYLISTGSELYDYPKLGDFQGMLAIGANVFGSSFLRTDIVGITKPVAGTITTCPDPASITVSSVSDLRAANNDVAWTPVPANQTDTSATGWALATRAGGGNYISVFQLTKNASNVLVAGPPKTMTVAAYAVPPSAPQQGAPFGLDTLDTRFTQAVSSIDPARSNATAVWTQHTVAGGAGSQVRWYQINPTPATPVPFQSGTQSDPNLFLFNAAIAPDRRRNGASGQFGSNMALAYNRSSSGTKPDIVAVGKVGTNAVTAPLLIKTSTGVIDDFGCNTPGRPFCRWGDYAGASPDPASDTAQAQGQVWFTNSWAGVGAGSNADWRNQNFAVRPQPK